MKIRRLSPISDSKVKMVIHGDPGVGKTLFSSIAPKPILANCEGGLLCLDQIAEYHADLDIQVVDISSIADLQELFLYLKKGEHDRETLIIDSLGEVMRISMDEILKSPNRDSRYDPDTPMLQDYGQNTQRMRKLVRVFRDLPMHVIFTCISQEQKDDQTGRLKTIPALTPKIASEVMGYVDIVGYLFVAEGNDGESERKLLTQPKGKYAAKDRSGKLGVGLVDPVAYDLINMITGCEIPEYVQKIKLEVKK